MRIVLVILAILGGVFWWISQPAKVATRAPLTQTKPKPASSTTAVPPNLLSQTPAPAAQTTPKTPLGSALKLRDTIKNRNKPPE